MILVGGLVFLAVLTWLLQPWQLGARSTSRLSPVYWYLAGGAALLLLAAWMIAPRDWRASWSPEQQARAERRGVLARRFRAVADARDALLADLAVQHAVNAARARGDRRLVLIDTGVPAAAAAFVDSLVRVEAQRLEVSDTSLQVFVTRPVSDSSRSSALRARRPLDISWLLPDSTRSRCLAVVRLNRSEVSNLLVASATSLLGPCAFVARFGRPGAGIHQWLASSEYSFAAFPAWSNAGFSSRLAQLASRAGLSVAQSRCVLQHLPSCRAALAIDSTGSTSGDPEYTPVTFRDFSMAGPHLGMFERLFLSDLMQAHGAERFGAFWRSDREVSLAFASVAGHSLEEETSRWMGRIYDSSPGGPAVPRALFGALGLALAVAGITVRRRAQRLGDEQHSAE